MSISTIFFDLDDTLYPADCGLWPVIRDRIGLFMVEQLNISSEEMPGLRRTLFEQYGTTLRGLQHQFSFSVSDFLAFVHDVPLSKYLKPDPELKLVLAKLPVRKYIFTNADVNHAKRVLKALDLEDCFEGIIDVVAMNPYCKPMPASFKIAMQTAGELDPSRCVMIDDIHRTTRAARELGLFSILYGVDQNSPDANAFLTDWETLPILLSGIL